MAADDATVLQRIEGELQQQTAATEARFVQGDANVSQGMALLEARLLASEQKLAVALDAIQTSMTTVQVTLEARLVRTVSPSPCASLHPRWPRCSRPRRRRQQRPRHRALRRLRRPLLEVPARQWTRLLAPTRGRT